MSSGIVSEIGKDSLRQNLRRYTWQAYNILPAIPSPRILDLGCGTGTSSIELAILSKGKIDAVDKDKASLDILRERAKELYLASNIKTIRCTFEKIKCKKHSYDIVWSEAAISAIGFEKGITEWKRFLKPGGFMVIHDEIGNYRHKLERVSECGLELIDHFIVPHNVWMDEYFAPLAERINKLKARYGGEPETLDFLEREETEIDILKQSPERFASVFIIMREKQGRERKMIGFSAD